MRLADLSDHDAAVIARFVIYMRACAQAERAGVPTREAQRAIYQDVYGQEHPHAAAASERGAP